MGFVVSDLLLCMIEMRRTNVIAHMGGHVLGLERGGILYGGNILDLQVVQHFKQLTFS